MKKQENRYNQASEQIMRIRRLYSQIGEPLPVAVLFDLHRHLPKALQAASAHGNKDTGKNGKDAKCIN